MSDKIIREFEDKLQNKLEELFPKLNTDKPEIKSQNHRSEALSLYAFANVFFLQALSQQKQEFEEMIDKVDNSLPKIINNLDKKLGWRYGSKEDLYSGYNQAITDILKKLNNL